MGGRGASSGLSVKGLKYGTEFKTILQVENIKFVRYNGNSSTSPMETMSKDRIYVTVNKENRLKSIVLFNKGEGKRKEQIDLDHQHKIDGEQIVPHAHIGYFHAENGTRKLNDAEIALVDNNS